LRREDGWFRGNALEWGIVACVYPERVGGHLSCAEKMIGLGANDWNGGLQGALFCVENMIELGNQH